ncbi:MULTISPECIES: hypothetical protein [Bacillus]|nr:MULTISPECIES: hypothetical protein [Bacillus cereus group]MEC3270627.1 hypothetical protein [Bacillus thuringiensis]SME49273.1 hypothetical protein BACERE00183_04252 [Bacillus cereus]
MKDEKKKSDNWFESWNTTIKNVYGEKSENTKEESEDKVDLKQEGEKE